MPVRQLIICLASPGIVCCRLSKAGCLPLHSTSLPESPRPMMLVSIFFDADNKSALNKLQRKHVQEAMLDLELEAYFKAGTMPVGT